VIRMLFVVILSALCIASPLAPVASQDRKESGPKEKQGPSLKIGDPAPTLKATKWLQGEEVKKFEPGKIYVVEFWATWCGPCIAAMPHLAELQAQYKDKGITVIGFTNADPNNSEEKVVEFVKKRGPELKYTFAYADDSTTLDSWMKAAGRTGIPCTFVVDKAGRIAYIGHPMTYLDMVLPKVVAGTATARSIGDEMVKIEAEYGVVSEVLSRDPKAGLEALKEFEAKYPPLTNFFPSVRAKLSYLPKFGKDGEAKEYTEAMVLKAIEHKNRDSLEMVSIILRLGDGKESKELMAVAVKAAEAIVQIGGENDASALLNLASTYFVAGDKTKAKEYARKAVAAADGEPAARKQYIVLEAKKLGAEDLEDKK
jgi:thiol-disulfide isomerase/thioredoxin